MKSFIKNIIRQTLIQLRLPITRNIRYDILTEKILGRELKPNSNCIDIGAHKGEILSYFLRLSPGGHHIAFEPIPYLYSGLKTMFENQAVIYPYALSNHSGTTEFNLVLDDPAYSGLQKRKYKSESPAIEKIQVEVKTLDELLANHPTPVHLIKIDVEGGEFDVLKGAIHLLKRDHPLLIFECGRGASEYYGTNPAELFAFLDSAGYQMYTLHGFYNHTDALSLQEFLEVFEKGSDYYFVGK